MAPLKASKVNIQDHLGAEFITQDLPCSFGEARILMVLDPLNGSRPCRWKLGQGPIYGTMEPLGPQQDWVQGASNSPTDCGSWTVGHQHGKWTKMAIYQVFTIFTPRPKKGLNGHKISFIKEAP
ncbi:hypothetical protein O181_036666 [Austropuccinia psidii MF-1]|uniref:Uncharacterized protein n=1 Tax=Austropuccinia psidii MF-1 TaxID=1389203 RepID=A0A9Q3D4U5_9BASI|nr:hypothetical protein [Austropuccinia psidii MF-1]